MTEDSGITPTTTNTSNRLRSFYFTRAAFAIIWVVAAFTVAASLSEVAGALLLVYPAWDAAANFIDARRNGGVAVNPSQSVNAVVSVTTTAAVAIALGQSMNAVLGAFGAWADDPQRCPVGGGGRHVPRAGQCTRGPEHFRHCSLRGIRRLVLSDLSALADRGRCPTPKGGAPCDAQVRHTVVIGYRTRRQRLPSTSSNSALPNSPGKPPVCISTTLDSGSMWPSLISAMSPARARPV